MITGQIDFIISVDVDCADEDALNLLTENTKKQIEEAFPKYQVECGDQDVEETEEESEKD